MKKIIITVLVLALVIAGAVMVLNKNKAKNEAQVAAVAEKNPSISVRTAVVQQEMMNGDFSVNGNFLPATAGVVAAETGGQVVALYVKEGSRVNTGQVIAKLKGDKQDVGTNNARIALEQAVSALNRYEEAYKTGGVTALQLDQARFQVKQAKMQLQSAQLNSGDTTVRSKISGVVNRKNIEVGTVVGAGTTIVEVVNIGSLKLRVEVDENMVTQLSVGQTVKVKPSVLDGEINGTITFIAPAATGAMKFPVEITVNNDLNTLKAGMYATAHFGGKSSSVLTVPREAFVGSVSENKIFVNRNGVAQQVTVQSGVNYGDKVEIISGLKAGDIVITSGQINLTNGAKVSVLK
ncbi:efflux RND transporter periplasmic adaptor subunit [Bergeyella zoohelcum]|uniref:Efflux transporter, RND family, MFP subunit n=1 Tax=Bergeyella zoohelcum ATCC 43767 TaxID=883096 RepID=K1MMN6_9FLAO|nr:efflux RND transporter periplasmic adaptor subunit [Bergeyella zoohelcum]EKB57394.1 efflux transporter, RND family, MFP subunit [Bergeyella zoohelcum ATCC 43767]SUV48935.1 Multidrug resistance protein MdtE precursor [Bergeyella zoohelcum]